MFRRYLYIEALTRYNSVFLVGIFLGVLALSHHNYAKQISSCREIFRIRSYWQISYRRRAFQKSAAVYNCQLEFKICYERNGVACLELMSLFVLIRHVLIHSCCLHDVVALRRYKIGWKWIHNYLWEKSQRDDTAVVKIKWINYCYYYAEIKLASHVLGETQVSQGKGQWKLLIWRHKFIGNCDITFQNFDDFSYKNAHFLYKLGRYVL